MTFWGTQFIRTNSRYLGHMELSYIKIGHFRYIFPKGIQTQISNSLKRSCPISSFIESRGGRAFFFPLAYFCFSITLRCPLNVLKLCGNIFGANRNFSKRFHTFKVKIENFPSTRKKSFSQFMVFFRKRKNFNMDIKNK